MARIEFDTMFWDGDHEVKTPEESSCLFLKAVTVNGSGLPYERAKIEWDEGGDFLTITFTGVPDDAAAIVGADEAVEGTGDGVLILLVSSLSIKTPVFA